MSSDALFTLAEVAVGLLGFAALTTALIHQRGGSLGFLDQVRFYWIILNGLVVIVGCFIPQWLNYFIDDGQRLWLWSSILYSCEAVIFFAVIFSSLVSKENYLQIFRIKRTWWWITFGFAVITITPIILNLTSWPIPSNQVFYEFAMLAPMVQMVFVFVDLVAHPTVKTEGT